MGVQPRLQDFLPSPKACCSLRPFPPGFSGIQSFLNTHLKVADPWQIRL